MPFSLLLPAFSMMPLHITLSAACCHIIFTLIIHYYIYAAVQTCLFILLRHMMMMIRRYARSCRCHTLLFSPYADIIFDIMIDDARAAIILHYYYFARAAITLL